MFKLAKQKFGKLEKKEKMYDSKKKTIEFNEGRNIYSFSRKLMS